MKTPDAIRADVVTALQNVIDPETGSDVVRMRLIQDLVVDPQGGVSYVFRPSSPLCPIALTLVLAIIEAIKTIPEVSDQSVTVKDYVGADELNRILATLPLRRPGKNQ